MSSGLRDNMQAEEDAYNQRDQDQAYLAQQQAREQERADKAAEAAQKKAEAQSQKMSAYAKSKEYDAAGIYSEKDALGNVVAKKDAMTGKTDYRDMQAPVQYPETGKPYQMKRGEDGKMKQEFPDAKATIGDNPNDPTDSAIYRKNKAAPWDRIDPQEGLLSPEPEVKRESSRRLLDDERKALLREAKLLTIEGRDPANQLPSKAELEKMPSSIGSEYEDPKNAEILKRAEERDVKVRRQNEIDTRILALETTSPDDYAAERLAKLDPNTVQAKRSDLMKQKGDGIKALEAKLLEEEASLQADYQAFVPQTQGFRADQEAGIREKLGQFRLRKQMVEAKRQSLDQSLTEFNKFVVDINQQSTQSQKERQAKPLNEAIAELKPPTKPVEQPADFQGPPVPAKAQTWPEMVKQERESLATMEADPSMKETAAVKRKWLEAMEKAAPTAEPSALASAMIAGANIQSYPELEAARKKDFQRAEVERSKAAEAYRVSTTVGLEEFPYMDDQGNYDPANKAINDAKANEHAKANFLHSHSDKPSNYAPWGELTINPTLFFKDDGYKAAVDGAAAPAQAKQNAMAQLPALQQGLAAPVFEAFLTAGGIAGSFRESIKKTADQNKWTGKGGKDITQVVSRWTAEEKVQAVKDFMASPGYSPNWNQVALGASSGADAIQQQYYGMKAYFGIDQAGSQKAGEEEMRQQEVQGAARQTSGGSQPLGALTQGAMSLIPSIGAGIASGGLAAVVGGSAAAVSSAALVGGSIGAGMQSAGSTMIEATKGIARREANARSIDGIDPTPGAPISNAGLIEARVLSTVSGAITATLTRLGGATGSEAIFGAMFGGATKAAVLPAVQRTFVQKVIKGAGDFTYHGAREAFMEELPDQALQNVLAQNTFNPDRDLSEGLWETTWVSFLLGGGMNAVTKGAGAIKEKFNGAKLTEKYAQAVTLGQGIAMAQSPDIITDALAGSPLEAKTPAILSTLAEIDARIVDGMAELDKATTPAAKLYSNKQLAFAYAEREAAVVALKKELHAARLTAAIAEIDAALPPEEEATPGMSTLPTANEKAFAEDKRRAKGLIKIAAGQEQSLDEDELNLLGLARDDKGKLIEATFTSDDSGVTVRSGSRVKIEDGKLVIRQGTIDRLVALFPKTEPLIGKSEAQRREEIQEQIAAAEAAKAAKAAPAATAAPAAITPAASPAAAPAASPTPTPTAAPAAGMQTFAVEVEGMADPVMMDAANAEEAKDLAFAAYPGKIINGVKATGPAPKPEAAPAAKEAPAATPSPETAPAVPQNETLAPDTATPDVTPAGITKALAATVKGKPSKKQAKRFVAAGQALSKEIARWQAAFPGGVRTTTGSGSGGVQAEVKSGALVLDLPALAASIDALEGSSLAWVERVIQEEAIHGVALMLEREGKIDLAAIFASLPAEMKAQVKAAYTLTSDDLNLGHEFFRMWIQQRLMGLKAKRGQPVLTEQAFPPAALKLLADALNKLLNYFRDLSRTLQKQKASPEVIERVMKAGDLIEAGVRALDAETAPTNSVGKVEAVAEDPAVPAADDHSWRPKLMFRGEMRPYSASISQDADAVRVKRIKVYLDGGKYETIKVPQEGQVGFATFDDAEAAVAGFVAASQNQQEALPSENAAPALPSSAEPEAAPDAAERADMTISGGAKRAMGKVDEWISKGTNTGKRAMDTNWERGAMKRFLADNDFLRAFMGEKQTGPEAAAKIAIAKATTFEDLKAAIGKLVTPASTPPTNEQNNQAALTPEEQTLKDLLSGVIDGTIQSQPVTTSYSRDIPESIFVTVLSTVRGMVNKGIDTPEKLGASLTKMGPAFRQFSEAIWSGMGMTSSALRAITPNWDAIYTALDKPAAAASPEPAPAAKPPVDDRVFDADYTGPRWTYGMRNRPVGIGAAPKGYIIGSGGPAVGRARNGTIQYPRELTSKELYDFEMELMEQPETPAASVSPENREALKQVAKMFNPDGNGTQEGRGYATQILDGLRIIDAGEMAGGMERLRGVATNARRQYPTAADALDDTLNKMEGAAPLPKPDPAQAPPAIPTVEVGILHKDDTGLWADTRALQVAGKLPGVSVEHMGYGDFIVKTPVGEVDFGAQNGNRTLPGQSGRLHFVTGPEEAVKWLTDALRDKGVLDSTPAPLAQDAAPDPIRDLILSDESRLKKAMAMKKLSVERGETVKQTQEYIESRLVQIADEIARGDGTPEEKYAELVRIYDQQPLFSSRTSTSMENQAYSTPIPMAYALGHMTGVTPQTSVYDGTAGNGVLAIGADLENSVANEIDATRRQGLESMGIGTITDKDATLAGAFPSNHAKVDVVHLNPPFGTIPNVNYQGYGMRKLEHIITVRALEEAMKADGTAAIIMGATMNSQEQSKGAQWVFENYLYGNYNVVDNFEVTGDLYGNQGAKWPVRILVLAGKRTNPVKAELAPKTVDRLNTWPEVWERAQRTRYEVERQRQTLGTEGQSPVSPDSPEGATQPENEGAIPGGKRGPSGKAPKRGRSGGNRPGKPDSAKQPGVGSPAVAPPGLVPQPQDSTPTSEPPVGGGKPAPRVEGGSGGRPDGSGGRPGDSTRGGGATGSGNGTPQNAGGLTPAQIRLKALAARLDSGTISSAPVEQAYSRDIPRSEAAELRDIAESLLFDDGIDTPALLAETLQALGLQNLSENVWSGIRALKASLPATVDWSGTYRSLKPNKPPEQSDAPRKKATATETQIPYDPESNGAPFETLIPRGIGEAVRAALEEITANRGPIDEYVAGELDMSVEDLLKAMSAEQVDGVAMAIYQMETGGALIIGDETGIGKGRQAASLIRYAVRKGKIPVFFTKDPKLFSDMWGDLQDINTPMSGPNASATDLSVRPLIFGAQDTARIVTPEGALVLKPATLPQQRNIFARARTDGFAQQGYNAIFTTYSQIRKENDRQAFLEWLAENDDVVIVLDEAHEAAGNAESSMQAAFMMGGTVTKGSGPEKVEITKSGLLNGKGAMHPRGGALYLSATFAKRPDNMPVYFRTDLRKAGEGIGQVVDAMSNGGVALQQAVTEALAEAGQYIRRERDFTGVSYSMKRVQVDDEADLVRQVDEVTEVLSAISNFSSTISASVAASTALSDNQQAMTEFASIVHNQVGQLLLAAKADAVVAEVLAAKERGEKPIVALMNTMESFLSQYIGDMEINVGDAVQLSWSELLQYALSRTLRVSEKMPDGSTQISTVDPEEFGLGRYYQRVMDSAKDIQVTFPVSPIDYIIQKAELAGVKMGELTGRQSGIQYTDFTTGEGTYKTFKKANKNTLVNGFNGGALDAMLLNASGSTGLSIHASEKFKDQQPRHMIIAQPALDINVFIQTLGRIKRTGIVMKGQYPDGSTYGARYSHLTLPLNAELRPAVMAARKMKSLNANTTGESDSAVKIEAEDLMNRFGNRAVAEYLNRNPELASALNLEIDENKDGEVTVPAEVARQFTGRMSLRPDAEQGAAYAEIIADYRRAIEQAKVTGDYDLEIIVHDDWDGVQLNAGEQIITGTDESSILTASVYVQPWEITDNRPTPSGADMLREFQKENGSVDAAQTKWEQFAEKVDTRLKKMVADQTQNLADAAEMLAEMQEDDAGYKGQQFTVNQLTRNLATTNKKMEIWGATKLRMDEIIDRVGQVVQIEQTETNELDQGMLTQIKYPDLSKGLRIAPSAFKFTYLLDRPGGRIYPSLAQFRPKGYSQSSSNYTVDELKGDRGGKRQTRTIIVGNPVRAYAATGGKGKVVRFKSREGELVTGLMMPRNWRIKQLVDDPRMELTGGASVARYFVNMGYSNGYLESGENIRLQKGGGYKISAPVSRRTGKAIFFDKRLIELAGEFTKTGNRMVATFYDAANVAMVADRITEITGKRLRGQDMTLVQKANGVDADGSNATGSKRRPKSAVKEAATKAWTDYIEGSDSATIQSQSPADLLAQANASKDGFYSAAVRLIEAKMPSRAPRMQVVGMLTNAQSGVKADEIKWTGIVPWLSAQSDPVSKEAVLEFLRGEGNVQFEEVTLRDQQRESIPSAYLKTRQEELLRERAKWAAYWNDSDEEAEYDAIVRDASQLSETREKAREEWFDANPTTSTKYAQYQLPGGENYREVVLSMPPKGPASTRINSEGGGYDVLDAEGRVIGTYTGRSPEDAMRKARENGPTASRETYTSSHFTDVPNYVAHMRTNERADATGAPGLFIEEIQSDRAQKARKDGGFRIEPGKATAEDAQSTFGITKEKWAAMEPQQQQDFINEVNEGGAHLQLDKRVPDMPFAKTWPLQMFKRALRDAVASGKQWIGWTDGATQGDRFDLSKQVDAVLHSPSFRTPGTYNIDVERDGKSVLAKQDQTPEQLTDIVGKEITRKIVNGEGDGAEDIKRLSGNGLKVGGEGMKGFYDKILPTEVAKYVKQWGGSVEQSTIEGDISNGRYVRYESGISSIGNPAVWGIGPKGQRQMVSQNYTDIKGAETDAAARNAKLTNGTPIWRVEITPRMADAVKTNGQAIYSQSPADLLAQANVSMADVDARAEKANWEYDGARTVGDPTRAGGAGTGVESDLNDVMLAASDIYAEEIADMPKQKLAHLDAVVRGAMEADPEGNLTRLIQDGMRGVPGNAFDVRMRQMLKEWLARQPATQERREQAAALTMGDHLAKRTASQILGASRDMWVTKAERFRAFMMDHIYTPPPAMRVKILKAPTEADRQAYLKQDQERIQRIIDALAKMGVTIEDVLNGGRKLLARRGEMNRTTLKDMDAKKMAAAMDTMDATQSFKDIAAKNGMTVEQVKAAKAEAMAKVMEELRNRRKMAQRAQGIISSQPVTDDPWVTMDFENMAKMSDADAEVEMERIMKELGWFDDAQQGKRRTTKRRVPKAPPAGDGSTKGPGKSIPQPELELETVSIFHGMDIGNQVDVVRMKHIVDTASGSGLDVLREIYINWLLSGPVTQATNIVGNVAFGIWNTVLVRAAESTVNAMTGNNLKDSASFGEFIHIFRAAVPGMIRGAKMAKMAWGAEHDFFETIGMGDAVGMGGSGLEQLGGRKAISERPFGKISDVGGNLNPFRGRVVRMPGRSLMAADSGLKTFFGTMEVAAHAYRLTRKAGIAPGTKAFDDSMNRMMYLAGSPAWDAAVKQAEYNAFQQELNEAKNPVDGIPMWLMELSQSENWVKKAIGTVFFPFVKTPYNIAKTATVNSPLGTAYLMYLVGKGGLAAFKGGKLTFAGEPEFVTTVARQILAWAAYFALQAISEGDEDDDKKKFLITGSPPKNRGEADLQKRALGGAYMARLGGVSFNYGRLEPFATVVASTVDALRSIKRGDSSSEVVTNVVTSLMYQARNKTFLTGLSSIGDILEGRTYGKEYTEILQDKVISSMIPNLIKQPLRNYADTEMDTGDAPWWHSALPLPSAVGTKLDPATGEEKLRTGNSMTRMLIPSASVPNKKLTLSDKVLLEWNRLRQNDGSNDDEGNPGKAWAPKLPSPTRKLPNQEDIELNEFARNYLVKRRAVLAQKALAGMPLKADQTSIDLIRKAYSDGSSQAWNEIKYKPSATLGTIKK